MKYTFYDFGASKGGSTRFAMSQFGGNGLSLDIDPVKIAALRKAGLEGEVVDLAAVPAPRLLAGKRRQLLSIMFHFLEHLPSFEVAERVINNAVHTARDFVVAVGPDFEQEAYLKALSLRKYYTLWSGHTWHHSGKEFDTILSRGICSSPVLVGARREVSTKRLT